MYANSQAYKSALSYSGSPYNYGMYDLANYGSWFAGPGGACWRPAGFGMGWDPFALGAWNYYPTGWVFVSPYAWGWTPYRYGAWNWYDTTGWCWNPGGYMGWNTFPVIYTYPQSFLPPVPPNKPGGPPVFIGGRKVIPGAPADPNAFRKPAKGMDPNSFRKPALDASGAKTGAMPTAKQLTPVPSGRAWGSGGAMPHGGRTPMPTMRPNGSMGTTHEGSPRPSMPRPSSPAPHYEPAPRMERMAPPPPPPPPPPAMPAPSAHPH